MLIVTRDEFLMIVLEVSLKHKTLLLQVWPYLFGHYKWDFSSKDRRDMDRKNQSNYENKLSDWMAIDAIVRQRDKEITAANIAKLSGEKTRK